MLWEEVAVAVEHDGETLCLHLSAGPRPPTTGRREMAMTVNTVSSRPLSAARGFLNSSSLGFLNSSSLVKHQPM